VRAALPLADVLEHEWQSQVVELAQTLGWKRIYHTFNSRRSAHGFPDLVLIRDRVLFLELKREKTKLTDPQKGWIRALLDAGADAYVVRPRDLESLAAVLAARIPTTTILGRCEAADALRAASWEESA
jgi:hypothetical protein